MPTLSVLKYIRLYIYFFYDLHIVALIKNENDIRASILFYHISTCKINFYYFFFFYEKIDYAKVIVYLTENNLLFTFK